MLRKFLLAIFAIVFVQNYYSQTQAQTFDFGNFQSAVGCYDGNYTFSVSVKVTGIRINNISYDDPTTNSGSFGFDVIFEYTNSFQGTMPSSVSNFWQYQLTFYTDNPNTDGTSITNSFYPIGLNTATQGNMNVNNNKSYYASASNLGFEANTVYTDAGVLSLFGYDSAKIDVSAPCVSASATTVIRNNPLSVNLGDIQAKLKDEKVLITWSTLAENYNNQFIIERSNDGKSWMKIGEVASQAQNGNSNHSLQYSFEDLHPLSGENLYRIIMIDYEGNEIKSKVTTISNKTIHSISVYPNPVKDVLYLNGLKDVAQISIIDMMGLQRMHIAQNTSNTNQLLDVASLQNGIYFLNIVFEDGAQQQVKLVVNK